MGTLFQLDKIKHLAQQFELKIAKVAHFILYIFYDKKKKGGHS